jgi:hypothetical protein
MGLVLDEEKQHVPGNRFVRFIIITQDVKALEL